MKALTLEHNGHKILAFQTGRTYGPEGQIILIMDMGDYVLMNDVSRGVDYALPVNVGLNAHKALEAYDSNSEACVSDWVRYREAEDKLESLYRSGIFDSLKITI